MTSISWMGMVNVTITINIPNALWEYKKLRKTIASEKNIWLHFRITKNYLATFLIYSYWVSINTYAIINYVNKWVTVAETQKHAQIHIYLYRFHFINIGIQIDNSHFSTEMTQRDFTSEWMFSNHKFNPDTETVTAINLNPLCSREEKKSQNDLIKQIIESKV